MMRGVRVSDPPPRWIGLRLVKSTLDADPEALISRLAGPLSPPDRAAFRRAAEDALTRVPCWGEGAVYRAVAALQRAYFNPPNDRRMSWDATSTTGTLPKVNRWDFSGIYEFEMEDEDCLIKKGRMKGYKQRTPIETLGDIASDLRMRTRQQQKAQPNRYWEKFCPPHKALLMVDAVAGDRPIYNLDQGSFVSHHVIGPSWDASQTRFYSVTPNGDTTGPNLGMFKIDGEINPNGSLDFFIFRPHRGKTGRLWPVVGLPKIWMTVDRFHAVKKLDVYCYLHIRPDKDCILWKRQDWDGYLAEFWKHRSIVRSLGAAITRRFDF